MASWIEEVERERAKNAKARGQIASLRYLMRRGSLGLAMGTVKIRFGPQGTQDASDLSYLLDAIRDEEDEE